VAITENNKIYYYQTTIENINENKLIEFVLNTCVSNKIYYIHNLTFEMYCFIPYFNKYGVTYELISADKSIYSAKIIYKNKIIKFRCSYKLTLLSLKDLAILAEVKNKTIFPYKILTPKIKRNITLKVNDFNTPEEYTNFCNIYTNTVDIYKILKEYCENDVYITKLSINKF
jgi:hypothetical protein